METMMQLCEEHSINTFFVDQTGRTSLEYVFDIGNVQVIHQVMGKAKYDSFLIFKDNKHPLTLFDMLENIFKSLKNKGVITEENIGSNDTYDAYLKLQKTIFEL